MVVVVEMVGMRLVVEEEEKDEEKERDGKVVEGSVHFHHYCSWFRDLLWARKIAQIASPSTNCPINSDFSSNQNIKFLWTMAGSDMRQIQEFLTELLQA